MSRSKQSKRKELNYVTTQICSLRQDDCCGQWNFAWQILPLVRQQRMRYERTAFYEKIAFGPYRASGDDPRCGQGDSRRNERPARGGGLALQHIGQGLLNDADPPYFGMVGPNFLIKLKSDHR